MAENSIYYAMMLFIRRIKLYILVCTNIDTPSQDFEEDIVTPLCGGRWPSLL